MREVDKIANEKFNGDMRKTLEYLMYAPDGIRYSDYKHELTNEEMLIAADILENEYIKQFGDRKTYLKTLSAYVGLSSIKMTEEEVINAPCNPYKAAVLKSMLLLFIANLGIVAMSLVAPPVAATNIFSSFINGLAAFKFSSNIVNYVKFKKLKKFFSDNKDNELNNANDIKYENDRGRSL